VDMDIYGYIHEYIHGYCCLGNKRSINLWDYFFILLSNGNKIANVLDS